MQVPRKISGLRAPAAPRACGPRGRCGPCPGAGLESPRTFARATRSSASRRSDADRGADSGRRGAHDHDRHGSPPPGPCAGDPSRAAPWPHDLDRTATVRRTRAPPDGHGRPVRRTSPGSRIVCLTTVYRPPTALETLRTPSSTRPCQNVLATGRCCVRHERSADARRSSRVRPPALGRDRGGRTTISGRLRPGDRDPPAHEPSAAPPPAMRSPSTCAGRDAPIGDLRLHLPARRSSTEAGGPDRARLQAHRCGILRRCLSCALPPSRDPRCVRQSAERASNRLSEPPPERAAPRPQRSPCPRESPPIPRHPIGCHPKS